MRAAYFYFDSGKPVPGWTTGDTWNGFACPYFDSVQLPAACAALEACGLTCGFVGVDGIVITDPEGNETRIRPDEEGPRAGLYSFAGFTWHATEENPFRAMGNDPEARVLAHCVLAATLPEETWVALRAARRLTGLDVAAYLDGACFVPWVDAMGEATDLEALKTQAANYLGEKE